MDASQLPLESLLARDASKRKRVNRNAKLKQFKLDARREQWLSQGKLVASLSPNSVLESPSPKLGEEQHLHGSSTGGDSDAESCVINHDDLCDGGPLDLLSCNFNSSVSKSSISCSSQRGVVLDPPDMSSKGGKRRSGRKGKSKSKNKASGDCDKVLGGEKGKDGGEEEEEEDWEAAADALDSQMNLNKDPAEKEKVAMVVNRHRDDRMIHHQNARNSPPAAVAAWKVEDTFRPASLPRIITPSSLPPLLPRPTGVERRIASPPPRPPAAWVTNRHRDFFARSVAAAAASAGPACCPICTEELDSTDSSFLPCACGFRLCLFCHHRIASDDGRCPGCRQAYKTDMGAILRPCPARS